MQRMRGKPLAIRQSERVDQFLKSGGYRASFLEGTHKFGPRPNPWNRKAHRRGVEHHRRPSFRRLHNIRQNGLLYHVFPSATHTRFEHSLGVVHVADSMLRALLLNSAIAAKRAAVRPVDRAEHGQAVDLSTFDDERLRYLFRITRLSALVHDLGHGPFSHTFDAFAPRAVFIADVIRKEAALSALEPLPKLLEKKKERSLFPPSKPDRVEHEVMSCVFFAYIWNKLGGESGVATDVAAVILGLPNLCDIPEHRAWLSLMHDVVASAPADADRMDYLERDSQSIGVTYGLFDRNRVLKSLLVYATGEGRKRVYRLGFRESGLRAVENLVQARFQMFIQVYYHKTNQALQHMLDKIASLSSDDQDLFNWSDLNSLVGTYQDLSDERFLRILRGTDADFLVENEGVKGIAGDIYHRHLWKRIYEGDLTEVRAVAARIRNEVPGASIEVYPVKPDAAKHLDAGAALLRRTAEGIYVATDREHSWKDASPLIKALAENESTLGRIYLQSADDVVLQQLRRVLKQGSF